MKSEFSKSDLDKLKKAQNLAKNNDWKPALNILNTLLFAHKKSVLIHAVLANIYWNLGELDKAIGYYKKATNLNPMSERASLGLYHCYDDLERDEEAIDEMKRFMSISDSEDYRSIIKEINES